MKSPHAAAVTLRTLLSDVSLALFRTVPRNGHYEELTHAGYTRTPVRFSVAEQAYGANASNDAVVVCAANRSDRTETCVAWGLIGTDGTWRYIHVLDDPIDLRPRDQLAIDAGSLVIEER